MSHAGVSSKLVGILLYAVPISLYNLWSLLRTGFAQVSATFMVRMTTHQDYVVAPFQSSPGSRVVSATACYAGRMCMGVRKVAVDVEARCKSRAGWAVSYARLWQPPLSHLLHARALGVRARSLRLSPN